MSDFNNDEYIDISNMTEEEVAELLGTSESKEPSYYTVLPSAIRYAKDINFKEKVLLSELVLLSNLKGYCWVSNRWLAELYDLQIDAISKGINNLRKAGYIEVKMIIKNNQIVKRLIYITDKAVSVKVIQNSNENLRNNMESEEDTYNENYGYNEKSDTGIMKKHETSIMKKHEGGIMKNHYYNNTSYNITRTSNTREYEESTSSPLSPHSTFEKFKNDFLRYYIKLTAITVSDINQINYFRNEIRRDELKNLFETSQGFYESEMEKAFEDAKKSQPKSRFFDFYDTLRILISERNQELVEIAKRSEEREKKRQAERLKWEAEERQMRADLERQAAEQGLTVEELLKIEEEELKRNFSSEFVGV